MAKWFIELKIYQYQKNPKWRVKRRVVKEMFRILRTLDTSFHYDCCAEKSSDNKFCVYKNNETVLVCSNQKILHIKMNVYEQKNDMEQKLQSMLISTAPEKFTKDIKFYLGNLENNEFLLSRHNL